MVAVVELEMQPLSTEWDLKSIHVTYPGFVLLTQMCILQDAPCWNPEIQLWWKWEGFHRKSRNQKNKLLCASETRKGETHELKGREGRLCVREREEVKTIFSFSCLFFNKRIFSLFTHCLSHLNAISCHHWQPTILDICNSLWFSFYFRFFLLLF